MSLLPSLAWRLLGLAPSHLWSTVFVSISDHCSCPRGLFLLKLVAYSVIFYSPLNSLAILSYTGMSWSGWLCSLLVFIFPLSVHVWQDREGLRFDPWFHSISSSSSPLHFPFARQPLSLTRVQIHSFHHKPKFTTVAHGISCYLASPISVFLFAKWTLTIYYGSQQ